MAVVTAGSLFLGLVGGLLTSTPRAAGATAPHVMVVMMENKNYSQVIGQKRSQPFTNALAKDYGLATESFAFGHPSLPNYLTLVSGSNQGVTDDNDPSSHSFPGVQTIADQLAAAGYSAGAYAEDLPANPATDSGEYAARHVPWEYFPSTAITVKDASALSSDLNSANPPDFVWFTPNLIDDEHDGTVQQGDAFLRSFIPAVQSTAWYAEGGQIIITWDESDNDNSGIDGGSGGGHIPTIVVSSANQSNPVKDSSPVDTAGILRSIEDRYGLAYLANAANPANGTIDSLLSTSSGPPREFTSGNHKSVVAGQRFQFTVQTSGTPTPSLKRRGHLPPGVHFVDQHTGTASLFGTPNPKRGPGTYYLTFVARYGRGRSQQEISQSFTLTVSP
jgi:phosphatidylinositol-3-phosphatase